MIFALLMLVTAAQAQPLTGALGPQPGPGDPAGAATAAVNAAIPATIGTTSPACGAGGRSTGGVRTCGIFFDIRDRRGRHGVVLVGNNNAHSGYAIYEFDAKRDVRNQNECF